MKISLRKYTHYILVNMFVFVASVVSAQACCDALAMREVIAESSTKTYGVVFIPSYSIRNINGASFEIYNDQIALVIARRESVNEPYKSISYSRLEDFGYDYFLLSISDNGSVVILSDSTNASSTNIVLRIFDKTGKNSKSFSRNQVLKVAGYENENSNFSFEGLTGYFLKETFYLSLNNSIILAVDCDKGNLLSK